MNEIICSKITHTELITRNGSNRSGSEPGSLGKELVARGGGSSPVAGTVLPGQRCWREGPSLFPRLLLTWGLCRA